MSEEFRLLYLGDRVVMLDLDLLVLDPEVQSRAEIDDDRVKRYRDAYKQGEKMPPLIVYYDGTTHRVASGFHRTLGARLAKLKEVPVVVRQGTARDAILYSVGCNSEHGLDRSTKDKTNAVLKLVRDKEWGEYSSREIAKRCRVTHPFVEKTRKENDRIAQAVGASPGNGIQEGTRKHTRNGKTVSQRSRKGLPSRAKDSVRPGSQPSSRSREDAPVGNVAVEAVTRRAITCHECGATIYVD